MSDQMTLGEPNPETRSGSGLGGLPCSAGFFWWRASAAEEWRMVHIVDFAEGFPGEPPHLAAYDVEKNAWGGRTLRMWALHDLIGEWVECHKPGADALRLSNEEAAILIAEYPHRNKDGGKS